MSFPTRLAPFVETLQPAAAGTFSASTAGFFAPGFKGEIVAVEVVNASTEIAAHASNMWVLQVYIGSQSVACLSSDSDTTTTITASDASTTVVSGAAIAAGVNTATLTGLLKDRRFSATDFIKIDLVKAASAAAITGVVQVRYIEGYENS